MPYARDYSVIEIKQLLKDSEQYGGHGFSKHHDISDSQAMHHHKSAFIKYADTNAVVTEQFQTGPRHRRVWRSRDIILYTKTVSDQPFMVSSLLNTQFGQAALKVLDDYRNSRIVIHAWPPSMGMTPAMRMRVPSSSGIVENGIGRVVVVIEGGWPKLHFVTAYPTATTAYYFKFGPNNIKDFPQTLPGIEHTWSNNQRKAIWQWSTHDQNKGSLIWKW